jgi:hypothetical protein
MNAESKSVVLRESSRFVGQIGNNLVLNLSARLLEIEALARTLGAVVESLPKAVATFQHIIPEIIHFQGDLSVAGGGVWPEPFAFSSQVERRSFFWGEMLRGTCNILMTTTNQVRDITTRHGMRLPVMPNQDNVFGVRPIWIRTPINRW